MRRFAVFLMIVFGMSASGVDADALSSDFEKAQTLQTAPRREVQIGILENVDPWFFVQMFGPTMEYLRDVLPAYDFSSRQYTIQELNEALKNRSLDFFIAPSGFFAYLADSTGAERVATRHRSGISDPGHSVGAVFVTRAEETRFDDISSLRGVRVAAKSPEDFAGWTVALGELRRVTDNPEGFFGETIFTGHGYPDVTAHVINNEADVGILEVCDLEYLEASGLIAKGALKVLYERPSYGLPCRVSSAMYPDVVFASLPRAESEIVRKLTVALLTMPPSPTGDLWGLANNFTEVNSLYKDLKIGPYRYLRHQEWRAFLNRYRVEFFLCAGVLILLLVYVAAVRRMVSIRTRDLQKALSTVHDMRKKEKEAAERLFQIERAGVVSGMSAMFAHDVRQPLTSLINYAGGLRQYLSDKTHDPLVHEALSEITTQASRVSAIVERVRAYAREDDRIREHSDMRTITLTALESFQKSAIAAEIELNKKMTTDPIICEVDPFALEVVLVNILRNAAGALRSQTVKRVDVELLASLDNCRINISDNGPELSDNEFLKLSHPVRTSKAAGLGLGLTIARLVVESHGGRLFFVKNHPHGLQVVIELPLAGSSRDMTP